MLCTSDLYVIFGVHFYVFGVILKCKEFTEHFLHFLHLSAIEKLPMIDLPIAQIRCTAVLGSGDVAQD